MSDDAEYHAYLEHEAARQAEIDDYHHWLHGLYYGRANEVPETDELRLKYIHHGCYIKHSASELITNEIEGLMLASPKGFFGHMALIGEEGTGKTIAHQVVKNGLGRSYIDHNIGIQTGIWAMDVPDELTEKRFLMSLIDSMALPYSYNDSVLKLRHWALASLEELHVKVLVIENTYELLKGWPADVRKIMSAIKYIADFSNVSILFVATPEVYERVVSFRGADIGMRVMHMHNLKNDKEFRKFLKSYELFLPLKSTSNLAGEKISNAIYDKTGGNVGAIDALLKKLASSSIESGTECISIEQVLAEPVCD